MVGNRRGYFWRLCLLSVVSMFYSLYSTIDISFYKNSYDCFKADKKYLSPLYGPMLYHTMIRGIYFIDPNKQPSSTKALCRELFYSMDDFTNFHYTTQKKKVAANFTPDVIADIILKLEELRTHDDLNRDFATQELKSVIANNDNFQKTLKATQAEYVEVLKDLSKTASKTKEFIKKVDKTLNENYRDAINAVNDINNLLSSAKKKALPKQADGLSVLQCEGLIDKMKNLQKEGLQEEARTLLLDTLSSWKTLCAQREDAKKMFDQALKDTGKKIDSCNYYSYDYKNDIKKAKEGKGDFASERKQGMSSDPLDPFVRTLVESCYESGLFKGGTEEHWYSVYTPYNLLFALLNTKFDGQESLKVYLDKMAAYCIVGSEQSDYERNVIDRLSEASAGNIPVLDDYRQASYRISKDMVMQFSDCMDNTLANIFKIIAFNPESREFDSKRLEGLSESGQIAPDLKEYFKKYSTSARANTQEGHDSWVQLLSNVRGMGYANFYNTDTGARISSGSFMHRSIVNQDALELEGINYQFIADENHRLYEAEVSVRNLIVACNQLLNLNLFDLNSQEFLQGEFIAKDFVSIYFKKLCDKLDWELISGNLDDNNMRLLIKQSNYTIPFMVSLNIAQHAWIQWEMVNPSETIVAGIESQGDMLYRFVIEARDKRSLWNVMETLVQTGIKDERLGSVLFAFYQSCIINSISSEDITNVLKYRDPLILLRLAQQIKKVYGDQFLIGFTALSLTNQWACLSYFYPIKKDFYEAIGRTGSLACLKSIMDTIVRDVCDLNNKPLDQEVYDFCREELNAVLSNPLFTTEVLINNLIRQQDVVLDNITSLITKEKNINIINEINSTSDFAEKIIYHSNNAPIEWLLGVLHNEQYSFVWLMHHLKLGSSKPFPSVDYARIFSSIDHNKSHFLDEIKSNGEAARMAVVEARKLPDLWLKEALNNQQYEVKYFIEDIKGIGQQSISRMLNLLSASTKMRFSHQLKNNGDVALAALKTFEGLNFNELEDFKKSALECENYTAQQFFILLDLLPNDQKETRIALLTEIQALDYSKQIIDGNQWIFAVIKNIEIVPVTWIKAVFENKTPLVQRMLPKIFIKVMKTLSEVKCAALCAVLPESMKLNLLQQIKGADFEEVHDILIKCSPLSLRTP